MKLQDVHSCYLYKKKKDHTYSPTSFPCPWQATDWPLLGHFGDRSSVTEKLLLSECFSLYRADVRCPPNFFPPPLVLAFGGTQTKLNAVFSVLATQVGCNFSTSAVQDNHCRFSRPSHRPGLCDSASLSFVPWNRTPLPNNCGFCFPSPFWSTVLLGIELKISSPFIGGIP